MRPGEPERRGPCALRRQATQTTAHRGVIQAVSGGAGRPDHSRSRIAYYRANTTRPPAEDSELARGGSSRCRPVRSLVRTGSSIAPQRGAGLRQEALGRVVKPFHSDHDKAKAIARVLVGRSAPTSGSRRQDAILRPHSSSWLEPRQPGSRLVRNYADIFSAPAMPWSPGAQDQPAVHLSTKQEQFRDRGEAPHDGGCSTVNSTGGCGWT